MTQGSTFSQFNTMAGYLYRCCWMGSQLLAQGLITSAQNTAMLAAWNTNIKFSGGNAFTLVQAAALSQTNLSAFWNEAPPSMKNACLAFAVAVLAAFPEQAPNNHPVSNWAVLINALASQF